MYILGYSGHAYVVLDAVLSQGKKVLGYFDQNKVQTNPYSLNYLGYERDFKTEFFKEVPVFPAIGDNKLRKKAHQFVVANGIMETKVFDINSVISHKAQIELSTFVSANAVVNSLAHIGKACIINSGAIIEHECIVGSYSHIAPGAVLAGGVFLGESCLIGAGAIIKQGIEIGKNATVGAGAVVIRNINENEVWVGNPARRIK